MNPGQLCQLKSVHVNLYKKNLHIPKTVNRKSVHLKTVSRKICQLKSLSTQKTGNFKTQPKDLADVEEAVKFHKVI